MISENVSHHLSHQMCNGGKVCLVGEHPDIAPSQFVICVMKYERIDLLLLIISPFQTFQKPWIHKCDISIIFIFICRLKSNDILHYLILI
jgi:hypothetical protein